MPAMLTGLNVQGQPHAHSAMPAPHNHLAANAAERAAVTAAHTSTRKATVTSKAAPVAAYLARSVSSAMRSINAFFSASCLILRLRLIQQPAYCEAQKKRSQLIASGLQICMLHSKARAQPLKEAAGDQRTVASMSASKQQHCTMECCAASVGYACSTPLPCLQVKQAFVADERQEAPTCQEEDERNEGEDAHCDADDCAGG